MVSQMYELRELFEQEIDNVSTEISPNDIMWKSKYDLDHYFRAGQSAVTLRRWLLAIQGLGASVRRTGGYLVLAIRG